MKTKEKTKEEMVEMVDQIAEYGRTHHVGFQAVAELLYAMLGHEPAKPETEPASGPALTKDPNLADSKKT